ncbi:MAG: isoleucine--tRNA ligase [Flavobacteriaceae bacterium]|nr:isoleucine--tRNA ligase [Flavobacteriaceae bacterium]
MSRFPQYDDLDLGEFANQVLKSWDMEKIFQKSINSKKDSPSYVFYEGPPSANGMPGIHHVMARTIKDIFCRYKTQKGFKVERKAGWDTHGLPIELGVEKQLGITKEDIGQKISVQQYNQECRKAVMRYTDAWNQLTKRIGFWVDMEKPYITYQPKYIESVWWLLQQIYKKGLLYKSYTIQPYSPMAGTGLSSHELNQLEAYKPIKDISITAQFKAVDESLPEYLKNSVSLYFLAWTTTPWTLPSNTALAIDYFTQYSIVLTYNQYTFKKIRIVYASDLQTKLLKKPYQEVQNIEDFDALKPSKKAIPFLKLHLIEGHFLMDIRYHKIWKEGPEPAQNPENAYRIIRGDFVTTQEGSGIVHTAPTFGADDMRVAQQASPSVPALLVRDQNNELTPLVDLKGCFVSQMGSLSGKFVKNQFYKEGEEPEKSVDTEIAIVLKQDNRAFWVEKYTHSYPHCWRTDKPILYYPLDSWFINVSSIREKMVALNQQINWKPKATGQKRFAHWLANASDWNLSRSRFWGTPLPIWRTKDHKETKVIGSMSELIDGIEFSIKRGLMDSNPFADFKVGDYSKENYEKIDLHSHVVDQIILSTEEGLPMYRESDLIDVWFDSGSMPYAQWHYPFENKSKIDHGEFYPADYIAEGVDQTRGWFYTLHAIGALVFDSVTYKNVVSNGLILDQFGRKMAKKLGNSVDPFETLETYGPDALRWYLISNANPWDDFRFNAQGIDQIRKKFFHTLYNIYSFFVIYANIDGYRGEPCDIDQKDITELDAWILSELNSLIERVDNYFEDYEPTKAARDISDFVLEKLSNWYVRLSRRRFWKDKFTKDKQSAYSVLHHCLITIAKLSAPIAPFYMDRLYRDLVINQKSKKLSVHLDSFPKANRLFINNTLERKINLARTITSLALSLRKAHQIKVRQPLQKLLIPIVDHDHKQLIDSVVDQVKAEINVKEVELIDGNHPILEKELKPNFKTLGPKYSSQVSKIAHQIKQLNQNQILELESKESIFLEIDGNQIEVTLDDVTIEFKDIQGWEVIQNDGMTLSLDMRINQQLKFEGIAREFVNRVQNLRKSQKFEITDRIEIYLEKNNFLEEVINQNYEYIVSETLAKKLSFEISLQNAHKISIDQYEINLIIKRTAL